MAFKNFPEQEQGVTLLQRSLERRRLAHAYLFTGHQLDELEALARTLAKTLNCQKPVKAGGVAVDSCDACLNCQKVEHETHADVHWVRPESKSRVITIDQVRELMREIQLKPTEAEFKVGIIAAADRLNVQAANAFLKTLEEPAGKSVLILLSTEPQRLLETILSRCLRLNFAGEGVRPWSGAGGMAVAIQRDGGIGAEKFAGPLPAHGCAAAKAGEMRARVEKALTARSPLEKYEDVEKELREKWEEELAAAIERSTVGRGRICW